MWRERRGLDFVKSDVSEGGFGDFGGEVGGFEPVGDFADNLGVLKPRLADGATVLPCTSSWHPRLVQHLSLPRCRDVL